MTDKELLIKFLTKAYAKTEDEINTALFDGETIKDDAFDTLLTMDAAKVKKLKDLSTNKHDEGYKKAVKETATKFEGIIKQIAGVDTDAIGDELVEAAKEAIEAKAKKAPEPANPEDVKKHPLFIQREKELIKEKEAAILAEQNKFNEFKNEIEYKTTLSKVDQKILKYFNEVNPILPKDKSKADRQVQRWLKDFHDKKYQLSDNDDEDPIILKQDGTRLETPNGHPVQFKDFVIEDIKANFEIAEQPAKGGTGNDKNKTQITVKRTDGINLTPKNEAEFVDALSKLESAGTKEAAESIATLMTNYQAVSK